MTRLPICRLFIGLLALAACLPPNHAVHAAQAGKSPVKVFILVGQSNMEGKGKIAHLEQLVSEEPATYGHLKKNGQWVQRDDVWIRYKNDRQDRHGKLTVGYGFPTDRIGPELGFGHVVGDALDNQVLIIKCAWGGRSLYRDFRPPSAGLPPADVLQKELESARRKNPQITLDDIKARYGKAYRQTVELVKDTLAHLKQIFPDYDGRGYELAGLVFFQGFNDVINDTARAEYGKNLVHLIRDWRRDLGVKNLPIVIGELGMEGVQVNPRYAHKHYAIRSAQQAPSKMPQFRGTVAFARTAPFVVKEGKAYDGGYHYRGRADTFYKIGVSFGQAMLQLLKGK